MKIRRPAFTLLEMIIVLGIAALTMLIGWPSMQRTIQKKRRASVLADLSSSMAGSSGTIKDQ